MIHLLTEDKSSEGSTVQHGWPNNGVLRNMATPRTPSADRDCVFLEDNDQPLVGKGKHLQYRPRPLRKTDDHICPALHTARCKGGGRTGPQSVGAETDRRVVEVDRVFDAGSGAV